MGKSQLDKVTNNKDKILTHKIMSKLELEELLILLADRNINAFSEIYRRFFNPAFLFGLQVCDQVDLVEDVVQDYFIWLLKNCTKVREVSNFESYVLQSIRKNIYTKLKLNNSKINTRQRYQERSLHLFNIQQNIEDDLIERETILYRQNLISNELNKLPVRLKEVLYLRYFEEYSYDEIAEILGISNQVARNYASRAIKKLRARTHHLDFKKLIGIVVGIFLFGS